MIFFLKLMSDLLFYLTLISVGSIFSLTLYINVLYSLPFFILSSALLAHRKFKYVAILPLIYLAFISFNNGLVHFVVLIIPIIYSILHFKPPYEEELKYVRVFKVYVKIFSVIALFIIWTNHPLLYFATFVSLFLICSVTLLRISRHDVKVRNSNKFKVFNIVTISTVFLTALIFSLDFFTNIILSVISFLYLNVVINALMFLIQLPFTVLSFIINLFSPNLSGGEVEDTIVPEFGWGDRLHETQNHVWAVILGIIIAIILIALAVYILIKLLKLLRDTGVIDKLKFQDEERYFLGKEKSSEAIHKSKIRKTYRKFLKLCNLRGIEIKEYMTTEETALKWSNTLGEKEKALKFRKFYIKNRYGEKELDKQEIKEYERIYKELKGVK